MAIIFFMTNNIIQAAVRVFRANFKLTSFFLGSGGEVNRHIGNYTATPPLILVKNLHLPSNFLCIAVNG